MGDRIIGMKVMKEITATVKGANEHCEKVFQKSFGKQPTQKTKTGDPAPQPHTESEMDKELVKTAMLLDGDARTYAAGLEGDAFETFLKKSADERTAEVAAHVDAEKVKSDAAAEAEKLKAIGDPEVVKLREKVASLEAAAQKSAATARDNELKDIAKSQFGAVPKAYDTLKSAEKLTEAERAPIMDMLKASQTLAKSLNTTIGEDAATEAGSAKVKHDNLVAERAKEKNISKTAAFAEIAADPDPEVKAVVRAYRAELQEASQAA